MFRNYSRKKVIALILAIGGSILLARIISQNQFDIFSQHEQRVENNQQLSDTVGVARVIDGDTIVLITGEKVRYIGVDTPETVHPKKEIECFGKEASVQNKKLVEGKHVRLVKDISDTDAYGRLLRFVYVKDESGTEIFVNHELVQQGFATLQTVPPDVAHAEELKQAQESARRAHRGLWSSCR